MRATLNIAFGLLLLMMQAVALVAPHSVEKSEACKCCSCGSDACTTTRTAAPPSSPLTAQAQESRAEVRKSSFRPVPQPAFPSPLAISANHPACPASLSPLAFPQPLYERFCFLLI